MGTMIVGVGRSGTSVLASRLAAAGGRLPNDLMPPDANHPAGFFESVSLCAFNDRLLAEADLSWFDPPERITPAMMGRWAGHRDEALDVFGSAFGGDDGWLWKDPRLTILYPIWERWVRAEAVYVAYRDPTGVASNIEKTDGVPFEDGLRIWARHSVLAARMLQCHPCVIPVAFKPV